MAKPPTKKMASGGKVYSGTFGEAFRAAKKDGVSDFKWTGKKGMTYTTETEAEKTARGKKAAPAQAAPTKAAAPPARRGLGEGGGRPAPRKPEAPSSGQANQSAYKDMMAKDAQMRRDTLKAGADAQKAKNDKYYADREAQRQRDNNRPPISLRKWTEDRLGITAKSKEAAAKRAAGGKAKGGKVTKKKYV